MGIQIADRTNRSDHRPVHTRLCGDYLLLGSVFPNRQQHNRASWSNGPGYILPKERIDSSDYCVSRQSDGPAYVRGMDSQRTSRHLSFPKIHLIPAPVP